MFCSNCGKSIPDGSQFCPECGAKCGVNNGSFVNDAQQAFNNAEQSLHSEFRNIGNEFTGNVNPGQGPLQTNRSLITYIILTIITCGIYGYWFVYKMAQDVNTACEGDGESTAGLAAFILLSIITCGIYAYVWYYKLGNRLAANGPRYGLTFQENGTTVIMWFIFGSLLCGIGALIAMNILIKNTNLICIGYNRAHGYMM